MKKKFLLIDDDTEMSELFAIFSRNYDIEWVLARDGNKGIELVKNNDFDLIFLDYKLLGLSGEETFREIRRIKPLPKIIILSGFLNTITIESISQIGYAIFIKKPNILSYDFFEFLFSIFNIRKSS